MFDYDIVIFRDDAHTYFLLHSVLWIRLNFDLDPFCEIKSFFLSKNLIGP